MSAGLDAIVERADALYHDIDLTCVKQWREAHGGARAVGYMPIYVPREIIDAAGMLPVGIMGGRGQIEIIRGDAWFQSYICQIPRSTIELALTGRLDCLDGFLFPSICDVIRNLSGMWRVLFPQKYTRYLDVPQNFDPAVGGRFFAHELGGLRDDLGKLAGRAISDDDLRASIARYNENRRAIEELIALRAEAPHRAPAWEAYLILYAGNLLPVEEHTAMVRDYVAAAKAATDRAPRDQARVVMLGSFCEQPPLMLVKTLERAGCYVVWDDTALGRRWPQGDVATDGDPIVALSDAFISRSPATAAKYQPEGDRGEPLVQIVKRSRAEGVVFGAPSFCDPALLDQPMLQDALYKVGIPWTAFKYAENLGQFQVIREQAGTFADSIKLWGEA